MDNSQREKFQVWLEKTHPEIIEEFNRKLEKDFEELKDGPLYPGVLKIWGDMNYRIRKARSEEDAASAAKLEKAIADRYSKMSEEDKNYIMKVRDNNDEE